MIIYLSGGMKYVNNNGANWLIEFGDFLKNDLGHDVIDPVYESRKRERYKS
jgi:hypothetical protein